MRLVVFHKIFVKLDIVFLTLILSNIKQSTPIFNQLQMDQIKLLRVPNQKECDAQKSFEFEQIVTNQHHKNKISIEYFEPWNDDSERNPFISIKSERVTKVQSPKVKKQGSLSLTKNVSWRSPQKNVIQRQSKILPIMDVGELNKIRRSLYPGKTISKLDLNAPQMSLIKSKSRGQIMLPSVTRQLSIERKIFLMKIFSNQQSLSSPQKSHRIRTIIHELRK